MDWVTPLPFLTSYGVTMGDSGASPDAGSGATVVCWTTVLGGWGAKPPMVRV